MVATSGSILSDDLLKRCMERAPAYDRDNTFFTEDFDELKASGYLNAAVPKELGGLGLNLEEIAKEQRRLAYHSAATALGVNMHFYCGSWRRVRWSVSAPTRRGRRMCGS